jgi:DNA phosphorothioation-dependent restriction protein DptG
LNHEKANSERKELTNYGYKTLIDKVKYLFPYLSLLENLSEILEEKDLKYFHFKDLDNSPENISVIDEINSFYRIAKSMEDSLIKSDSIEEAFNNLLKSTMEQFRSNSKKAVIDRFINAYESQVSSLFFQSRGRGGKVLILDQDTILLLTNLAIGDKGQLRFQDLMKEFKKRSIYFDNRSEEALLELYERVGNVNRKSDSGDAVYVKSI